MNIGELQALLVQLEQFRKEHVDENDREDANQVEWMIERVQHKLCGDDMQMWLKRYGPRRSV